MLLYVYATALSLESDGNLTHILKDESTVIK
jgi:hypothetical protein